jgi:hypothetical protein
MKIYGDKIDTLNPNDLLRFKLPNTVIDMKTLNFTSEFTTTAVGSKTSVYQNRYFPRLSSSVFQYVAVYINGVLVDNCQNYNRLFALSMTPNLLRLPHLFATKKLMTPVLNHLFQILEQLPILSKVFLLVQLMIPIVPVN